MSPRPCWAFRKSLLAAALVTACAATGADRWVPGTPADLARNPALQAEEAAFILNDHTEVTLVAPRLDGATVQGASVSSCTGPRCDTIRQTLAVERRHVAWMSARYATAAEATVAATPTPSEERERAAARVAPRLRGDVAVLLGGSAPAGAGSYGGNPAIGVDVRLLGARGLGGAVAFRASGPVSMNFDLFGSAARSPSVKLIALDLSAVYRARLAGDERDDVGVSVGAGLAITSLHGDPGQAASTCGLISWGCVEPPYTPPPRSFDDGVRVTPLVAATLDGRVSHFLIGMGASWRGGFAEAPSFHVFTFDFRVGVSLW